MKLSSTLLQAISIGIAVSTLSSSCQQNAVDSGRAKEKEMKPSKSSASKEKENKGVKDSCPACGMG